MGYGANAHLGLGKESTWGSQEAATVYVPFISENITHEIEQIMEPSIYARPDEPEQYAGLQTLRGDLVFEGKPTTLGYFLNSCFGTRNTSGAGDPYTHVFTPRTTNFHADCALQPYTLDINRDLGAGNAFQIKGAVFDRLQFECGVGQKILKCTAGVIAKDFANIAISSPTHADEDPFLWHQAAISIASAPNAVMEGFSIALNNGLEGFPLLNATSRIGKLLRNGFRTCDVSLTFHTDDLTEYNRFIAQTEAALSIVFTVSANIALTILVPKLRYVAAPVNVGGPGRMTLAVTGKGKFDSTDSMCKVTLKNSVAAY
jgi:hypothetical protein